MAITVTESYTNTKKGDETLRNACDVTSMNAMAARESDSDDVIFHRHCQATVLSAYGYKGAGMTWNILCPEVPGDLPNLQNMITGRTWQSYFNSNDNNITQDLRSILELIDLISSQIALKKKWTVEFYDTNKNPIDMIVINPWENNANELTYAFKDFGRFVNLNIDGQILKFHTIRSNPTKYGSEALSITFPKKNLTLKFNDDVVGTATGIYMTESQNKTLTINHDHNRIQATHNSQYNNEVKWSNSGNWLTITPNRKWHIYRAGLKFNANTTFNLKLDLTNYLQGVNWDRGNQIIEFEVHVNNMSSSSLLTLNNISIIGTSGIGNPPTTAQPLTDQKYVTPGYTNAWVFRIDMWQISCIYSLAYEYAPRGYMQQLN